MTSERYICLFTVKQHSFQKTHFFEVQDMIEHNENKLFFNKLF